MEHPSKRQRLSDVVKRSDNHGRSGTDKSPSMASMSEGNGEDHGGMRIKNRGNVQHRYATRTVGVVETVTASVLDVIIDNGSSAVAAITLSAIPTEPTVIAVPALGSLTIPAYPFSASSIGTQPVETKAPGNAGSQTSASWGYASAQSAAASAAQSSLSIQVPNMSSQIVLSSPPSTPLPSSQTMSLPSASSGSYFPSSTTGAVTSAESSIIGTSTSASFLSLIPNGNFSTATITTTNSGSTFTGTTTFQLGPFTSNSTGPTAIPSTATLDPLSSPLFTTSASTGSASSTVASGSSQTLDSATLTSSLSTATSTSASFTGSSTAGTGAGGGIIGDPSGTGTGTASTSPSASTSAAASGSSQSNSPPTPAVVGGVVGGVAGLAILLVLILFLLRLRRRRTRNGQVRNGDTELAETNPTPSGEPMTERSSSVPLAAAGLAPFLRRLRPHSAQTNNTDTTTSERGFQNLGGRRIESVLSSGGDGYGDPGPSNRENLAGSSFYRDSQGMTYGGPGSVPSSTYVGPGSPPTLPSSVGGAVAGSSRPLEPPTGYSDKEVAVMRPGPARTPVTSQGGFTPPPPRSTPPPRATPSPRPPPSRDGIGRSHPSLDGSRGSRFAENLG